MEGQPQNDDPELTLEEARIAVSDLTYDLYRAQDTLAWVRELCEIRDRAEGVLPGGGTVTTGEVTRWLDGPQCGRSLGLIARTESAQ